MKFLSSIIIILSFSLSVNAQTFSSKDKRVSLLELYTSEGCSSCPPADKWFSKLQQDERLWSEVVPIALHVDYWDYIGWQDPYAEHKYTQRQRNYANQQNSDTIYTPGMLLNGDEWRSWFYFRPLSLDSDSSVGKLTAETNGNKISAKFTSSYSNGESLVLNIAILGFDLESKINAGENEGKTLKHNFVVIGHKSLLMTRFGNDYIVPKTQLPKVKVPSKKTAIAVWVNIKNNLTPIQATGGWLDN